MQASVPKITSDSKVNRYQCFQWQTAKIQENAQFRSKSINLVTLTNDLKFKNTRKYRNTTGKLETLATSWSYSELPNKRAGTFIYFSRNRGVYLAY